MFLGLEDVHDCETRGVIITEIEEKREAGSAGVADAWGGLWGELLSREEEGEQTSSAGPILYGLDTVMETRDPETGRAEEQINFFPRLSTV